MYAPNLIGTSARKFLVSLGLKQRTHIGTPGRIRTCDLRIRSPLLYPTELRAQVGFRAFHFQIEKKRTERRTRNSQCLDRGDRRGRAAVGKGPDHCRGGRI